MRKVIAAALVAVSISVLTACSSTGANASCSRLSNEGSALNAIKVEGETFSKPTVKIDGAVSADKTESKFIGGDSSKFVNAEDQVSMELSFYNSETGELITQSPYDGSQYANIALTSDYLGGIQQAITCAPVGSRVVSVIVGDASLNQIFSLADDASVVAVFDIKDSAAVEKADVKPAEGEQMPTVTNGKDGAPFIKVPKADPPAATRVVVEKAGDGQVVKASDTVSVNYLGVLWSTGEKFDSSWDRGEPADFPLNGVVAGFKKGLEGQTVGSRVTIVVTPEDGYGAQDTGSIPANSYLVFVVDILAIK